MDPSSPETPQPNPTENTTATSEHEGNFLSKAKDAVGGAFNALTHLGKKPDTVDANTAGALGSVSGEAPQATDSPVIPDQLEAAAANNPESAEVAAAASVNSGSIDTGTPTEETSGLPASINTAPPTLDGTVGAPSPVKLRPDTADAAQPPVAPTAETPTT